MKVREFSAWVAEHDELIQAGQTAGEGRIKDAERKMGRTIPGPLRELYRLHDGLELTHGYIPPLAGDASLGDMIATIEEADLGWDLTKWLPFFDYQNGDYDAMEIASKEGRVGRLDTTSGEMNILAESFEEWIDLAVARTQAFEREGTNEA